MAASVSTSPEGRRRAGCDGDARKCHRFAVRGDDRVASALAVRHARLQQHPRDRAARAGQALPDPRRAQDEHRRQRRVERVDRGCERAVHRGLAVERPARNRESDLAQRCDGRAAADDRDAAVAAFGDAARAERHRARPRARARQCNHALGSDRPRSREARDSPQGPPHHGQRRRRDRRGGEAAPVAEQIGGERVEGGIVLGQQHGSAQQVGLGGRMQRAERRQQIEAHPVAREAAVAVRGVVAPGDSRPPQLAAHLLAAQLEQRPNAPLAVGGRQGRERRGARRGREAVEDRLDAVVARVPGRDGPAGAHRVARPRGVAGARVPRRPRPARRARRPRGEARPRCAASARQASASASLSAPRSPCATCSVSSGWPSSCSARASSVESAPPDTRTSTGSPGSEQTPARDRRADAPDQLAVERHVAAIRPA